MFGQEGLTNNYTEHAFSMFENDLASAINLRRNFGFQCWEFEFIWMLELILKVLFARSLHSERTLQIELDVDIRNML